MSNADKIVKFDFQSIVNEIRKQKSIRGNFTELSVKEPENTLELMGLLHYKEIIEKLAKVKLTIKLS
jgi:hypothetical protein